MGPILQDFEGVEHCEGAEGTENLTRVYSPELLG